MQCFSNDAAGRGRLCSMYGGTRGWTDRYLHTLVLHNGCQRWCKLRNHPWILFRNHTSRSKYVCHCDGSCRCLTLVSQCFAPCTNEDDSNTIGGKSETFSRSKNAACLQLDANPLPLCCDSGTLAATPLCMIQCRPAATLCWTFENRSRDSFFRLFGCTLDQNFGTKK